MPRPHVPSDATNPRFQTSPHFIPFLLLFVLVIHLTGRTLPCTSTPASPHYMQTPPRGAPGFLQSHPSSSHLTSPHPSPFPSPALLSIIHYSLLVCIPYHLSTSELPAAAANSPLPLPTTVTHQSQSLVKSRVQAHTSHLQLIVVLTLPCSPQMS